MNAFKGTIKHFDVKAMVVLAVSAMALLLLCSGCGDDATGTVPEPTSTVAAAEKEVTPDINNTSVQDDSHVYMYDDPTSVVTMYLTVSLGNSSEGTDHTWKSINSYSVFDYLKLGIPRYQCEALLQVGDENGPIPGELGYGLDIPNAVVQIRGNTTSLLPQKSYKIVLKKNVGDWRQERTIDLNKHGYDGLRFRNKLFFDLIKQIPDMFSMRTQFVHLYVKDETEGKNETKFADYGLYTQVEQLNTQYLKTHGLDSGGQLYKANLFEFERYDGTVVLKTDPGYDVNKFNAVLKSKGDDDNTKLIAMLDDLNDYSKPIEETFEKYFDENNYFTWLAFNILTGNIDSESRNFYIYSPKNGNKWYFIPWDGDAFLSRQEYQVIQGAQDVGFECGVSNYWGSVLHNRVLRDPKYRAMLDDKIQSLRKILSADKINSMASSYSAVTKNFVYSMPDIMHARLTPKQYTDDLNTFANEVESNYQLYVDNLKKPMPFFVGTPAQKDGKLTFQWDAAYDFRGQDITYTFELGKDYLFKDVIYQQKGLAIPSISTDALVPGQYFFRIIATNQDGQSQTAMTYYVVDSIKYYGTQCFYVLQDGTVALSIAK